MVEFSNLDDFMKISYANEFLSIYDKNGKHMTFLRLPNNIFEEFKQSGFPFSYLRNNIINNHDLGYKAKKTHDGYKYSRE